MAISRNFFALIFMLRLCFFTAPHLGKESTQSYIPVIGKRNQRSYESLYGLNRCSKGKEVNRRSSFSTDRRNNEDEKNVDILVAYSDSSGKFEITTLKTKDLSTSWIWDSTIDERINKQKSIEPMLRIDDRSEDMNDAFQTGEARDMILSNIPVKLQRMEWRQKRRSLRTAELLDTDKEKNRQIQEAAIRRSSNFDTTIKGKYSIWRRDYENPNSDSILKLIRDQIIMAKVYASIAKSDNKTDIFKSLMTQTRKSQGSIGEAHSDAQLHPSALDRAKEMGRILSLAKDQFYDCNLVARKLRAMIQITEDGINEQKKKSGFLTQLAAKTLPRPLHCLSLHLTSDFFLLGYSKREVPSDGRLEDPSLFHYAIFSDNVLATSVVINSTALNVKEPEKHVFHVVTDKLNFAAMKMWFILNSPAQVAVHVDNINDFKWLNSSYCSVLRQLESAQMKEYYFKSSNPSSLSAGSDNLKYRNPKYLSMLNHLRFYLPEVYPKLTKILFLDDDIVVQKDLTPLWDVDMKGMVNGAVETCKESFHTFDKYLNFSNNVISDNFDPNACGWAFGMNLFDLNEWKRRNITGIYHRWQDMNEDRMLWKLGSLPPGLITFYNLTYPLDRRWHVLGLGYDPALNQTEIDDAAVVHYNGNYKPWLDLAVSKYKPYWARHVHPDNTYLTRCNVIS